MPRGWKPKQTEAERICSVQEETRNIIEHAMIDRGVKHKKDLAELIDMVPQTLSAKFKSGSWSQQDLCRIISALKIAPENAVRMLGVRL